MLGAMTTTASSSWFRHLLSLRVPKCHDNIAFDDAMTAMTSTLQTFLGPPALLGRIVIGAA